jgi:hypothetical protein
MKEKLTMKNLRIFNSMNSEGQVIRTPEPSEVGELNSKYRLANWLHCVASQNKITDKQYIRHADYLDSIPLVGDYFRFMCAKDYK